MDYKMYKESVPAGQNVIPLIKESLRQDGIKIGGSLRFVGFEASPGVEFYLNGTTESDLIEVPSCGNFITPFDGERGTNVHYLAFKNSFNGAIYYII